MTPEGLPVLVVKLLRCGDDLVNLSSKMGMGPNLSAIKRFD